jgi:hypothetical protein
MTVRGFLLWYLGAVSFVGAAGASGYQAMLRQHAERTTPAVAVAVAPVAAPITTNADARPQAAAAPVTRTPPQAAAPSSTGTAALPPLRPHVAAVSPARPVTSHPAHRVTALPHPIHRPVVMAAVPREIPRYQPRPPTVLYPPPPPPRPAYYAGQSHFKTGPEAWRDRYHPIRHA